MPKSESELLHEISHAMPQTDWRHYNELIAKRQAETITALELNELIAISNQLEEANAHRIAKLVALAQMRGVSLKTVMNDLGIHPPSPFLD
jgi:hypothetical protein